MLDGWYNALRFKCDCLWDIVAKDRVERFKTGKHGTIAHSAHPHEKASVWPAPETWPVFKKFKETVAPNHEHWTTVQSFEYAIRYDVTPYMKRIIHQPTLMVTSWYDDITMTEFEVGISNYTESQKRVASSRWRCFSYVTLDNLDHLQIVGSACANFAKKYL